jgi:hypothetical protein
MSRLIFNADTLGGTTTLSSADAVGNFTLTVPAVNGTLSVKDASDDATFRNITLTGAVLAGAWNGSTITVPYGGTGVTTLSGLVFGNGTSAMTAATAAQVVSVIGATFVTNATNATSATSATTSTNIAGGLSGSIPYQTGAGATALLPRGTNGQVLTLAAGLPAWVSVAGTGTVTSIDVSGGTTGLTTSGGPVTGAGTITLAGTLAIANGGTGATTDSAARTALGLGTMAVQAASSVAITGGAIDGTTVGSTTVAAGSFTTLNSSGATRLGGLSGNQSLQVNNVASAVNYAQIVGAVTGSSPTISAQGTDADIAFNVTSKGFGVVNVNTGTGTIVKFVDRGTTTVDSPYIFRAGLAGVQSGVFTLSDSGIMQVPGATGFQFRTNAGASTAPAGQIQAQVSHTASAVNYLQFTGAATGAAPTISAQGSDANIDLTASPKGAGYFKINSAYSPNLTLTDAATVAWDTSTAGGQVATFTFVSTNRTMGAPTNLKNGGFYALAVIQNAGSNTLTWNSVFKWAAGTAPTLSTAAGAKDYFTFRSDGTNLYQQGISQAVA